MTDGKNALKSDSIYHSSCSQCRVKLDFGNVLNRFITLFRFHNIYVCVFFVYGYYFLMVVFIIELPVKLLLLCLLLPFLD
jgi:hypothetical protein